MAYNENWSIWAQVDRVKNNGEQIISILSLSCLSHARYLSNFTDNGTQAIASGLGDMTL